MKPGPPKRTGGARQGRGHCSAVSVGASSLSWCRSCWLLRTVGFASSSGVNSVPDWLEKRHLAHINATATGECYGEGKATADDKPDQKFNLLVANRRAQNAAKMLRRLASSEAFDIRHKVWCSHDDMVGQRKHKDTNKGEFSSVRGLMNRRAEVRLKYLSGCLNVHPDKRVVNGDDTKPG